MDYKKAFSTLVEGNGAFLAKRVNWPSDKIVHWDSVNSDLFIREDGNWKKYNPTLEDAQAEDWFVARDIIPD